MQARSTPYESKCAKKNAPSSCGANAQYSILDTSSRAESGLLFRDCLLEHSMSKFNPIRTLLGYHFQSRLTMCHDLVKGPLVCSSIAASMRCNGDIRDYTSGRMAGLPASHCTTVHFAIEATHCLAPPQGVWSMHFAHEPPLLVMPDLCRALSLHSGQIMRELGRY